MLAIKEMALQELLELQQCGLPVTWPRANTSAARSTRVPPRAPDASREHKRPETEARADLADETLAELLALEASGLSVSWRSCR